jgi:UDP-glucose:(heptosyl)LPS alpha-1,3-glucosyltransferase
MTRLKIAFIVHDYHRHGGHARYVVELAERYAKDHEVHVFANRFEVTTSSRIRFHHVPAIRQNALFSILSFVLPASLQTQLSSFDIVHSQGLCGLKQNITTMHFCQEAWFDELHQQGIHISLKQRIFQALVTPLERRILTMGLTRSVIAISNRTVRDLHTFYNRDWGVSRIYHGVDLDRFHPDVRSRFRRSFRSHLNLDESRFIALYVGDAKKGLATAIRAVSNCENVSLAVVSGSNIDREITLAHQLGCSDRVFVYPHSKSVEKFFSIADLFLFPTVYDPYGMVISEAMAMGLPVITSPTAGASELIENSISGVVTSSAWNVPEITTALKELSESPTRCQSIGLAARKAIEPWTWDRCANATLEVYRSILDFTQ